MELDEIMRLIDAMNERGITKLGLKTEGYELNLERGEENEGVVMAPVAAPVAAPAPVPAAPAAPVVETAAPAAPSGKAIKAPVVGTFYASPSPDAAPFVKVGDTVTPDTVVAIVEAMKVMNEVRAEVSGVISSVLCSNGDPVEFGTPLFEVQ